MKVPAACETRLCRLPDFCIVSARLILVECCQVEVDKKSHGQKATNMKSLSGGERSFSTLAFIMAIGTQIGAPFHCLDEFDVFLDAQNRQVSDATWPPA